MFLEIVLFVLGLICLIFGGNWFVDGAVGIAHRLRMSEVLIGATIVSIGTTLPEVMVSATSAVTGHGEIAYGNAIGSIICNTALILAITISIRPSKTSRRGLALPIGFFFAAAIVFAVSAYIFAQFSRIVGIVLLVMFVAYMFFNIYLNRNKQQDEVAPAEKSTETPAAPMTKKETIKSIVLLVIGAALIAVGARLLVDNGTLIAEGFGVPESVIALTFVALGTSLPELVTAITSLIKGHSDISLGNIVGANLFNLVLVSGLSITISPFGVPAEKLINGMNASLIIDIPLMFLVMLILVIPVLIKGKLYRAQGIILLLLYFGFCAQQFIS